MEIERSGLEEVVRRVTGAPDLPAENLPDLDLYMDQIITLFERSLGGCRRNEQDKVMTKTMINNYSKEGLLGPIKGKKYGRRHLIAMLMIYYLKQTLSIADIKRLFEELPGEEEQQKLNQLYADFLTERHRQGEALRERLAAELTGGREQAELLPTVLALCSLSDYFKRMAEQLLDQALPVPAKKG